MSETPSISPRKTLEDKLFGAWSKEERELLKETIGDIFRFMDARSASEAEKQAVYSYEKSYCKDSELRQENNRSIQEKIAEASTKAKAHNERLKNQDKEPQIKGR